MSKITIRNLNNKEALSHNNLKTVLNIIHDNHIDWMHACGGKGRCTTCKLKVIDGDQNFSELSTFEKKLTIQDLLTKNERLACQCTIHGDIAIEVPDENKLPHLTYSY